MSEDYEKGLGEKVGEGIGYGITIVMIPLIFLGIIMLFHARMEYLFQ
mgnify:CR=1 FL=1